MADRIRLFLLLRENFMLPLVLINLLFILLLRERYLFAILFITSRSDNILLTMYEPKIAVIIVS